MVPPRIVGSGGAAEARVKHHVSSPDVLSNYEHAFPPPPRGRQVWIAVKPTDRQEPMACGAGVLGGGTGMQGSKTDRGYAPDPTDFTA